MSLFKRLFSSNGSSNSVNFDWISLTDIEQLEEIIVQSYEQTIVIFKHSTRCSISRFALNNFEKDYNYSKESMLAYYLDLIIFRDVSNEIARKFQIEHQSPQIIVIKKGKAIFSTSHENIEAGILERFV